MTTAPAQSRVRTALWTGAPVAMTVLIAIGYLVGLSLLDSVDPGTDPGAAGHSPWPALIVLLQAGILVARHRYPATVLGAVTVLHGVTLVLWSGEVGAGSFAVMVAVYVFARRRRMTSTYVVVTVLAVASVIVMAVALQSSREVPAEWILAFSLLSAALDFVLPVVIAEVVDGRARLVDALRERAVAAEYEKERRAQEAVLRERALMARELHDIAAHHLTGIIVGAQAADALRTTDPDRSGDYMRQVQADARTTLDNLRQTVGLLRAESPGELAPVPSIEQLPALVAEASTAGTEVTFVESGTSGAIGPLAGIAVYRMVQESLANALRHAPGASRAVEVRYLADSISVTVRNGPPPRPEAPRDAPHEGYGLLGMAERADLVGGSLSTGLTADGGWVNTLEIPNDEEPS